MTKRCFLFALLLLTAASGARELIVTKNSKLQLSREYIAVDPARMGEFSAQVSGGSGVVNIYLFQYNSAKRKLGAFHLNARRGTETELTAAVKKGDRELLVKDASKWNVPRDGNIVAFGAKEDLSDLPNTRIGYYARKVTKLDNGYRVEMSRALPAYPVGTKVRLHSDGGNLGWGFRLPLQNDRFTRLLNPAPAHGTVAGHWWKGTAFVRVAVQTTSDTPVTVKNWSLKAVDKKVQAASPVAKAPAPQKKNSEISAYGFGKLLLNKPNEKVFTNTGFKYAGRYYSFSGVSQHSLSIPAQKVQQFEVDFKAGVPGYLQLTGVQLLNKKRIPFSLESQSVIPDGQYRRFIFHPPQARMWNKDAVLISWNLKFHAFTETGKETGVRNVVIKDHKNLIPGAESLKPGVETPVTALRPNGIYTISWQNGKCPGAELVFLDHLLNPIPGTSLKIAPGTEKTVFKAPDMMIQTKFKLAAAGGTPLMALTKQHARYIPELYWRGKWIWSRKGSGPDYCNVWFSKDFNIDGKPETVALALTGDDVSTIYVNGKKVGNVWRYTQPRRFDLMKYVKPGRNNITVMVYNLDTAGGLCADLYTRTAKGGKWISTDNTWLCKETGASKTIPEKFEQHAVELGLPETTPPWAGRVKFSYCGPQGKFQLISSTNGKFTAKINEPVISEYQTLMFERRTVSGKKTLFTLPITRQNHADGTVTIQYPAIQPVQEDTQIFLADDFWRTEGNKALFHLKGKAPVCKGFRQAEFVNSGKRTMIRLDGKLHDPAFYMTAEWERMAAATGAGFRNFLVPARLTDFWKAENVYDFSEFDKQAEILTTVVPDAIFVLDIRLFMPEWWLKKNPDDTSTYYEKTRRNTYDDVQALGSKNWLAAAEAPMRALLKHVENGPYAHRIWAVNIGDSRGNEWFWGGARAGADFYGKPAQPGYSPSELKAFRNMLRNIYKTDHALAKAWNIPGLTIDKAEMPDHKLRRKGDVGSLFDSTKKRQFMDWCLFRNRALAEAINHFAARIKDLTKRKLLVGAYYGYMTELASNPNRSQLITGHNGYLLNIQSPDVDFFRAPSRYSYRKTGMPNGIMQTHSSFALRKNKVVYIEHDERNAYGPSEGESINIYVGRASTALESVGHFNREFGMFATQGVAQYWLDHARGSLYEPALLQVNAEHFKAYRNLPAVQGLIKPQISIVGDIDSIYYSIDGVNGIFHSAYHGLFRRINYLGAPFYNIIIHDLLEKDLVPPQKLYIMLPTLVLDAKTRKALMQRFAREKATVLWLYAAGSSYPEKGLNVDFCGDFLGMKFEMSTGKQSETLDFAGVRHTENFAHFPRFYPVSGYDRVLGKNKNGKAVLTAKKINGATHIFSVLTDLSREQLAAVADMAGIFRYSRNLNDPVWVGNDLIFIHSASTGKKQITLPEGVRMRSIIGPVKGVFKSGECWEMEPGMTCGFLLEKIK